eukprot:1818230-Heterocapsa_arctica.AAC.1
MEEKEAKKRPGSWSSCATSGSDTEKSGSSGETAESPKRSARQPEGCLKYQDFEEDQRHQEVLNPERGSRIAWGV